LRARAKTSFGEEEGLEGASPQVGPQSGAVESVAQVEEEAKSRRQQRRCPLGHEAHQGELAGPGEDQEGDHLDLQGA
jgi:hypothetical protein